MTDTKPWYLSRTIWASLVAILSATLGVLGVSTETLDDGTLPDLLLQAVTGIAGIVALLGRLRASARIG